MLRDRLIFEAYTTTVSWVAFVFAALATASFLWSPAGLFWAIGFSILGCALGLRGYRTQSLALHRLLGALAVTISVMTLLLSASKYILALAALSRL